MRFIYAGIAMIAWIWMLNICGAIEAVSDDTLLLTLSIVVAGGLAGGA